MKKIILLYLFQSIASFCTFGQFTVLCKTYDKAHPDACEYQLKLCYTTSLFGLQPALYRLNNDGSESQIQPPHYEGCGDSCDTPGADSYESNMIPAGTYRMVITLAGSGDTVANEIFTGPEEICDGIDNNCNGLVDESTFIAKINSKVNPGSC